MDVAAKPGTTVAHASAAHAPADQSGLVPLVERLEALSFTFEAMNASSRTYAAEAVLETLGRMERRDLQSLAAVEAFASALKTVSQHLAGLRNAIQTTAHDTANGFHLIAERLDGLESRLGGPLALPSGQGNQLSVISERLGHLEEMIGQGESFDSSPFTQLLEEVVHKVEQVEEKIDDLPNRIVNEPVDMTPTNTHLETIAERVANVERKIDEAKQIDVAPLRDALDTIAQRVARIEQRMESSPDAVPEGFDPAPITDVLNTIANRISSMENRVEAGPDLGALTSFLGMVNQRLERMETGLGMVATEESAPPPSAEDAAEAEPPEPVAEPKTEMKQLSPSELAATMQANTMEHLPPAAARQQVDNLLEQVLRVLSR
ncbi:hypothetical protein [Magnetospirillum sulfuroxidans]|uniref:Uncharacterized protein n=1 Tax=Magnetospirillum sulfuroxidans TaxID=611300 RepID=A0ABS5I8S4_9PROT|nr:hypothetical protein [Magnetospirillum sulfuroxidans]MBR9970714.1 hypothetical protein [Magnetospirillum sulfuroxidans]